MAMILVLDAERFSSVREEPVPASAVEPAKRQLVLTLARAVRLLRRQSRLSSRETALISLRATAIGLPPRLHQSSVGSWPGDGGIAVSKDLPVSDGFWPHRNGLKWLRQTFASRPGGWPTHKRRRREEASRGPGGMSASHSRGGVTARRSSRVDEARSGQAALRLSSAGRPPPACDRTPPGEAGHSRVSCCALHRISPVSASRRCVAPVCPPAVCHGVDRARPSRWHSRCPGLPRLLSHAFLTADS